MGGCRAGAGCSLAAAVARRRLAKGPPARRRPHRQASSPLASGTAWIGACRRLPVAGGYAAARRSRTAPPRFLGSGAILCGAFPI
ncbi:hypothetical protein QJS66_17110 [Kocuria rhizophila]|nr:hypothetical protein QJS66_17110 [Kocuria rhizophila]